MALSRLFLLFIIYSVIGWISEAVYCSIQERRFVNRGFLHGPLCPVYGFGGLLVVTLLEPFSGSVFFVFIAALVLTSVLEYITAWLLETVFTTRWWDYSDMPFNLNGRVCLLNSVLFACMSLIGVQVIHPFLETVLSYLSDSASAICAVLLAVLLMVDLVYTLRTLVRFENKLVLLSAFLETVSESKGLRDLSRGKDLRDMVRDLRSLVEKENTELNQRLAARLEALLDRTRGMRRLFHAFPSVQNATHSVELAHFRVFHGSVRRNDRNMKNTRQIHLLAVVAAVGVVVFLAVFFFRQ